MPINLSAPVNSLGYGVTGLGLALALDKQESEPALFPIGKVEADPAHHHAIRRMLERTQFFKHDAPSLRIWHQWSLAEHVGRGLHAAMPIFELDRFRAVERHHLCGQDALLVNSKWAKRVLTQSIDFPEGCIHVVPLAVDHSIFSPDEREMEGANTHCGHPTVFLNVGKWEKRKGHDVLADAFCKAFGPNDNVRLLLLCDNPCADAAYNARFHSLYTGCRLASKVSCLTRRKTQAEVADLMRLADCGVFPARAEGWNLDASEMLAVGKHVILTNYSAHTEWATAETTRLIEPTGTEVADDGVWFRPEMPDWNGDPGQWMAFGDDQMDQLVTHMREVHRLKQEGGLAFNRAGYDHMKRFTWEAAAAKVMEALS